MTNKTLAPILAACTVIILWSSALVGIRIALEAYTPGEVALLRYIIASIVMLVFYFALPKRQTVALRDIPALFIMGITGIGIYNIALNYGEVILSAGIASFIVGTIPVITIILAVVFLREKMTWIGALGVLVSMLGLAVIAFSSHRSGIHLSGIFEVFVAAIMGSCYALMQKIFSNRYHPIELTAFAIWGGTISLLFFAPGVISKLPAANIGMTLDIVYMGIFPGAIAYALWCYSLKNMPASKTVTYLYALPIVSTIMGYLILNEQPQLLAILGGLIALLGAFIANFSKK